MNIYVLLIVFSFLQALDVAMTLNCGGLAVEANPIVVLLWQQGGLAAPLAAKIAALGIICIGWGLYDTYEVPKHLKWALSICVVAGSAIPIGWNIAMLRR